LSIRIKDAILAQDPGPGPFILDQARGEDVPLNRDPGSALGARQGKSVLDIFLLKAYILDTRRVMVESLTVSTLPVLFLIVHYGGEALLRRRKIDATGIPPVGKTLFSCCHYAIVIPWGAMALRSWGPGLAVIERPVYLKWAALVFWALGFSLLFLGRFSLRTSFRTGIAREKTRFEHAGIFRYSRNPMYLGIYATLLSACIYTLNPVVLAVGIFIAAVRHKIVLSEERHLRVAFGAAHEEYCRRVSRYL
jgi:protein-S-isoprenylcysteine O-methyltransferase Ste14